MSKVIDAIERLLFGATAQERVDMTIELASRRMEQRVVSAIEAAFDEAAAEADSRETRKEPPMS